MTVQIRPSLEQPTPDVRAARIAKLIVTVQIHSTRSLLDPDRCSGCGTEVALDRNAIHAHAAEQALVALPEAMGVEVPADAELVERALQVLDGEAGSPFWRGHMTRVHNEVFGPLIAAMVTEIRTVGLAWETLSGLYADAVAEHKTDRDSLTNERDHLRIELRDRNKAYGRASTTIGELRAHNARLRDQRFDAMTNRGAAIADLAATQRQVTRQQETILYLLNKVRGLGGAVDEAELLAPPEATVTAGR
ncbi:hypothetical protein SAMN04488074_105133 [Lentzea albidocapillata subsp. violacea]|uniref:Uncharacterized protein n=1 Tax=Lentzea albidocapillata subsp. violacea TaxID=128104 RepID=A0A1G9AVV9_9PSEU|nr:hypothetical protein [Lentzea albidocapillata]SDK31373.1 hypothetical protein SAMN04488074_105133 [Lentzea albidocapillata subsp. violacea]